MERLNNEVMQCFTNFRTGTLVLQRALETLITAHHTFNRILTNPAFHHLNIKADIVNSHHLIVEAKKYKPTFQTFRSQLLYPEYSDAISFYLQLLQHWHTRSWCYQMLQSIGLINHITYNHVFSTLKTFMHILFDCPIYKKPLLFNSESFLRKSVSKEFGKLLTYFSMNCNVQGGLVSFHY